MIRLGHYMQVVQYRFANYLTLVRVITFWGMYT